MKEFLKKIKLIDHFSTEIQMEKNMFVNKLKNSVDDDSMGVFSDTFDIFSSSKNEFKGHVGYDDFKIKRRRRFFDTTMNFAIAQGTYIQKGELLVIDAEINGFKGMMIPFYIFIAIFYAVFIGTLFIADSTPGVVVGFAFPFLLVHATFMFGIPYIMMRRSVIRMKHELEREFYYLTK
jgi:hypothetical protein